MTPNTRQHADDVLVQALATGKRVAEAAALAGVSTRTVFRRLQDHDFKERLAEVRTAALTSAAGRLSDHLVRACEVLTDLVWVDDPHLRLKAAKAAIELTLKVQAHQDAQANAPAHWGSLVVIGEPDPGLNDDREEDRGSRPDDPAPRPVPVGPGLGQSSGGVSPGSPPAGPAGSREGSGVSTPLAGPVAEDSPQGVPKSDKCCQTPVTGLRPGQPRSCGKECEQPSGCRRGVRPLASRPGNNLVLRAILHPTEAASDKHVLNRVDRWAARQSTQGDGFASSVKQHGPDFGAKWRRGSPLCLSAPAALACPAGKLTSHDAVRNADEITPVPIPFSSGPAWGSGYADPARDRRRHSS